MRRLPALLALLLLLSAGAARAAFDWKKKLRPPAKTPSSRAPIAVAGVRGLDEPGSPGDVDARDPESVAWLEQRPVSKENLDTFVVTGGLAP